MGSIRNVSIDGLQEHIMSLTLAVVGDRHYSDYANFSRLLTEELERFPAEELVTGDATGVDTMAYQFAVQRGIPVTIYCASRHSYRRLKAEGASAVLAADWDLDGKGAGHRRNTVVLSVCNRVLLFDGGGPGSANVRKQADQLGIEVERWEVTGTKPATTEQVQSQ